MKTKTILLYVVLLLACPTLFAQTTVLKGSDDRSSEFTQDELMAISAVKRPNCKLPTKFLILDIPGIIWNGSYNSAGEQVIRDTAWQETQTWQYFGQSFIANGLYNINTYRHYESSNIDSSVCVGYVLDFANINESFSNAFNSSNKNSITTKTIKTILKDKSYHEGVYKWLKPALVLAWKSLGGDLHSFYKGLISYVKKFDYITEKKYYERLKANDQIRDFTAYDSNGKYDSRRKAKAWIFRRIYFDGWNFAYTLKWINRIEKEIML